MSQATDILTALKEGRMLTPIDALQEFGCFRLAARIKDLRDSGYDIRTEEVKEGTKTFARYYLK